MSEMVKVSQNLYEILENFSGIENSIIINEGNVLTTINSSKSVYAEARIEEKFPRRFGIYDLSKFLGILKLNLEDSVLDFDEHFLRIRQGNAQTVYAYCPTHILNEPPEIDEEVKKQNVKIQFKLDKDLIEKLNKARTVLGQQEIAIVGNGSRLAISSYDSQEKNADKYSVDLGDTELTFTCILDFAKLRLLPGDYMTHIRIKNDRQHCRFVGNRIEYMIAASNKSTFESNYDN